MENSNLKYVPLKKYYELDEVPEMSLLLSEEDQDKVYKADKKITENFCKIRDLSEGFKIHMKKCIEMLKHIADCIDKVHKDTTVANVVGNSAGVVGGITTIVGLALTPFTLGVSGILSTAGIVIAAAGGLTGLGSSIVDFVYIKNQSNKANEIIEELMTDILNIQKYLSKIDNQLDKLKSLFGENTSEYSTFINNLLNSNLKSFKEGSSFFNSENVSGLKAFIHFADLFNLNALKEIIYFIQPQVQAATRAAQVPSRGAHIASCGARAACYVHIASDGAKAASHGAKAAARGAKAASYGAKEAYRGVKAVLISSGALVALGLAFDIFFLMQGTKELEEGAKTEQTTIIRTIASALEKDSKAFEGIFK